MSHILFFPLSAANFNAPIYLFNCGFNFRNSRCLVILDDLQTIFQSGQLAGEFLKDYKDYGKFLKQIARNHHQSCVILLSWEKSRELATLEGENRPNRTLNLKGLASDAEEILREQGLTDEEKWPDLINLYQGHPTWLNIIASTILELFDGRVSLFLGNSPQPDGVEKGGQRNEIFLGDLESILDSQLERLSELNKNGILTLCSSCLCGKKWPINSDHKKTLPQLEERFFI